MNFKRSLVLLSLCGVLALTGCMTSILPLEKPYSGNSSRPGNTASATGGAASRMPSQNNSPDTLSGVRVYYSGEGSLLTFETANQYEFRYKIFDSKPQLSAGQDVSDWLPINNGENFDGGQCRNIAVAAVDNDKLTAYAIYEYVPGVIYYPLSDGINEQYKYLAQSLSNWVKEDYSLGNASIMESYQEQEENVFCAGITMRMSAGQPVYSPIAGEIIYCGTAQDMNMVAVYNYEMDMTMLLLHMQDISPAREALEKGYAFEAGYLLGYAGKAGAQRDSLYIELFDGASFNSIYKTEDISLLRRQTLDPLILSSGGPVLSEDKPGYIPVSNKDGNMNNQGMAAMEDDWIYFINDGENYAIYKMRLDGTEMQEVCSDKAACLTVSEGWIYYCKEDSDNNIYKVRVDGTERVKLNSYHSNCLTVVGDWIYFRNFRYYSRMYRMKTDGSEVQRLTSNAAWGYFWHDGSIYHIESRSGEVIYRADFNQEGAEVTKLNSSASDYICIADGWLYYVNRGKQNYIYKMRLDGSENQQALDVRARRLNYADGWLYFTDMDENQKMYRARADGSEISLVADIELCIDINISGNWLFFRVEGSEVKQYMMNLNTSEVRELA